MTLHYCGMGGSLLYTLQISHTQEQYYITTTTTLLGVTDRFITEYQNNITSTSESLEHYWRIGLLLLRAPQSHSHLLLCKQQRESSRCCPARSRSSPVPGSSLPEGCKHVSIQVVGLHWEEKNWRRCVKFSDKLVDLSYINARPSTT